MHVIADPSLLAALWKRTRAMFARARAAIGEPQAIATRALLARDTERDIAAWLGRLESIVRKLLLAIAAGLVQEQRQNAPPPTVILRAKRAATPPQGARSAPERAPRSNFDTAHPETWPARFMFAPPRDPRAVPEARAPRIRALWGSPTRSAPSPPAPRRATNPSLRFALRLEALRRVLADPIKYAQRLARIFRRLSRRYPEAAPRYAAAPARPCFADPEDPRLIIEAIAAAIDAAPTLADTG